MDRRVPGNVTPRRASRFFLPRVSPPSPTRQQEARRATIPLALQKRRSKYRASSAYLSAFASGEDAYYVLASDQTAQSVANPLSLAFLEQYLAVGDDEGRVSILDTLEPHASALAYSSEPLVHGSVFALEWHDDLLAIGGSDCTVRLWDAEKQAVTITWEGHAGSPRALAWSPDGYVTSGARDGDVYVWDARTPAAAVHIPRAHAKKKSVAAVTALAYLPGGQTSGLRTAIDVLDGIEDIDIAELTSADVVRHKLVSEIVDAYEAAEAKVSEHGLANRAHRRSTGRTRR